MRIAALSILFGVVCGSVFAPSLPGGPAWADTPIGTAFTYQGSLSDGGIAPTAVYDFRFTLFDASVGGNSVSASLDLDGVAVVSGIFTVELDFGAIPFSLATAKWLLVEIRPGPSTGTYTPLPRQKLNPTPSAIGLALPHIQSTGSDQALFSMRNTGTGSAAEFQGGGGAVLNYGVLGSTWSTALTAAGVRGEAKATSGGVIGVEGVAVNSPFGIGLVGTGSAGGAYITGTGPTSTGVTARGTFRGLSAENLGTGSAVFATGQGGTDYATVWATNLGTGPTFFATGQGQWADNATLKVENTSPVEGVAAFITSASNFATAHFRNAGSGQILWLEDTGASGDYIVATGPAGIKFWVDGAGTTHTKVLEILGGSDLSEKFDVRDDDRSVEPGMVVSIDPEREGGLELSHQPYDRRVAGILSGAGGVSPGMLMGQKGSVADGAHPVALTGRVYCRATASNGSIRPGDLLTTSALPGCAMRVDDPARAAGAILGKAMGSLETGEGLVLVLVGLQ
jgi:hypothetical protein